MDALASSVLVRPAASGRGAATGPSAVSGHFTRPAAGARRGWTAAPQFLRHPKNSFRSGAVSASRRGVRVICDATAEQQRSDPNNVADALRDLGSESGKKNRIVVLGSGWGSIAFGAPSIAANEPPTSRLEGRTHVPPCLSQRARTECLLA